MWPWSRPSRDHQELRNLLGAISTQLTRIEGKLNTLLKDRGNMTPSESKQLADEFNRFASELRKA